MIKTRIEILESIAQKSGYPLPLWLGRALKKAGPEIVDAVWKEMGWDDQTAVRFLDRFQIVGGVERVRRIFRNPETMAPLRFEAALTLTRLGDRDPATLQMLWSRLKFGDMRSRCLAVSVLEETGDRDYAELLLYGSIEVYGLVINSEMLPRLSVYHAKLGDESNPLRKKIVKHGPKILRQLFLT
jgi:hypothetical protein